VNSPGRPRGGGPDFYEESWLASTRTPWRPRAESNRRTGLCRPLPKPLGHAATDDRAAPIGSTPYRRPGATLTEMTDETPDAGATPPDTNWGRVILGVIGLFVGLVLLFVGTRMF